MSFPRRRPTLVAALGAALALVTTSACSGGSSDVVGAPAATQAPAAGGSGGTINLYAYAVPKPGFDKLIPAFTATAAGQGVTFQQSYGASGDQSRKVAAGAAADFVNFSVEPDVTRLVDAGLGRQELERRPAQGHPVRLGGDHRGPQGQPQGHQGLGRPAQARASRSSRPNPFSSGSAKWNLLAPYAAKSDGGKNPQAGLDYVNELVKRPRQDPAEVRPRGHRHVPAGHRRRADQLRERGDLPRAAGRPGRARHPAARRSRSRTRPPWSRPATNLGEGHGVQRLPLHAGGPEAAGPGRVPSGRPDGRRGVRADFPTPTKLWTIDDLGGWKTVDTAALRQGHRHHRDDLRRRPPE